MRERPQVPVDHSKKKTKMRYLKITEKKNKKF